MELDALDVEVASAVGAAWSRNTLLTRNSQWSRFIGFCHKHGLQPLPASAQTVSRFLVWQAHDTKFSTVNNYLSAINALHRFYGHDIDFRRVFLIKLVLRGIRNTLGDTVFQRQPFTVPQLVIMFNRMDKSNDLNMILWSVVITSFRSLLRKSNLVHNGSQQSDHVLLRSEVDVHSWGVLLHIGSTKTLQYKQYVLDIPIVYVPNKALCAASAIVSHMSKYQVGAFSPLFVQPNLKPVQYSQVLSFIKNCASSIGIDSSTVGCHSLRRSGTAYLHKIGVPLEDIMSLGDWKSLSVLSYLVTPPSRKLQIQETVALNLS